MIQGDIPADLRGFTNNDPHAVIDKESLTDDRTRVDLDTGQIAQDL